MKPKSPRPARDHVIAVRLAPHEFSIVEVMPNTQLLSISSYVRQRLRRTS